MSERQLAKKINAKLVANSGRGFKKGDCSTEELLIDFKETEARSYSIKLSGFRKHQKDAWREGKEAAIVVCFEQDNGRLLAIIDWHYLQELMDDRDTLKGMEREL